MNVIETRARAQRSPSRSDALNVAGPFKGRVSAKTRPRRGPTFAASPRIQPLLRPYPGISGCSAYLDNSLHLIESDGRHHVWVASAHSEGTLVYDQHNVIFAYGDMPRYEAVLRERGFSERAFRFQCPHRHSDPSTHVAEEEELLAHFPWKLLPLQSGDEYD